MHQPVKDNLEEHLRGVGGRFQRPLPPEVEQHLEACGACAAELREFERQTATLRALRAPEDAEPRAGFYARVMQRIDEARASSSVWAAFLDPLFAKRLAFASAALVLLLGTFLISTERISTPVAPGPAVAAEDSGATPQERDAVLAKLVSFTE
jgi:anti-sigma factor RsiW